MLLRNKKIPGPTFFALGTMLILQLILAVLSLYYFGLVNPRDLNPLKTAFGLLIPSFALYIYTRRIMKELKINSLFE